MSTLPEALRDAKQPLWVPVDPSEVLALDTNGPRGIFSPEGNIFGVCSTGKRASTKQGRTGNTKIRMTNQTKPTPERHSGPARRARGGQLLGSYVPSQKCHPGEQAAPSQALPCPPASVHRDTFSRNQPGGPGCSSRRRSEMNQSIFHFVWKTFKHHHIEFCGREGKMKQNICCGFIAVTTLSQRLLK